MEGTRGKGGEKDAQSEAKTTEVAAAGKAPGKPKKAPGKKHAASKKAAANKKQAAAKKPKGAAQAAKAEAREPSRDLWFRFSTRVRAVGYWIREKLQVVGRALRKAGERASDFWVKRNLGQRIAIGAAAGLVLLLLVIRFLPVPGVSCSLSAVKECPPDEQSFALVPADALLYAHMTLDRDSEQFERASENFDQLPDLRTVLTAELPPAIPSPSGAPVDAGRDILPWADRDLAVTSLPGPGKSSLSAFIVGVGDREGADAFLARIAPSGAPKKEKVGDAEVSVYAKGFASAYVDDSLVFGDEQAVRSAVNAAQGNAPALDGTPEEKAVRDELPESRFAEVYLSRSGVQRLLVGRAGSAAQLETFVDYGATDGFAAAMVAKDDGFELDTVSALNEELTKKNPSFFADLPEFEPTLAQEAGERAVAYLGLGDVGPTLEGLLKRSGSGAGLAGALRSLGSQLKTEAGVDPIQQLLPALDGQAALVAEPTDGVPFASLIVDGVDEDEVDQTLAALQKPVLQSIGTRGGVEVPKFEETEVDGVAVRSVRVSPTVNLSYAVFDGKLVISTDPAGVEQVKGGGDSLADSGPYEQATDDLPDSVSALVFLNLDELFGQVTRTDLVEDPFFANLSVLFENATSTALAVNGDSDQIRSELFLALD